MFVNFVYLKFYDNHIYWYIICLHIYTMSNAYFLISWTVSASGLVFAAQTAAASDGDRAIV